MTYIVSLYLLLLSSRVCANQLDGTNVASESHSSSLDYVGKLVQEEVHGLKTLIELDTQLTIVLNQLSSASGFSEINVEVGEPDANSGSGLRLILDDIVMVIPAGSQLSDDWKEEIKQEIEEEVANTLNEMIVDEFLRASEDQGSKVLDKVEGLLKTEVEAEKELKLMKEQLEVELNNVPDNVETEIDVEVIESDNANKLEIIEDEVLVVIPASTGRLTKQVKEELEREIVEEVADALGTVLTKDFLNEVESFIPDISTKSDLRIQSDLQLEENPVVVQTRESDLKPALRGTAIAQSGFDHPMFVPHYWKMPPNEQLWPVNLSMLSSISCLTLLLIVGVWTGIRRSRRRAVMDDSHFRWAEAIEYMDAFPHVH